MRWSHTRAMGGLRHSWSVSVAAARALQRRLREHLIREDALGPLAVVAGADVAFTGGEGVAAVVTLAFPALTLREVVAARCPVTFPYVPGFLTFREGPALQAAFRRLRRPPDLVLFDGHGLAHPARFGLACHLGLLLDVPAIGCAKSLLTGAVAIGRLGRRRGARRVIRADGEVVGAALRTADGVRPIFVSAGHRLSLPTALRLTLHCCRGYRVPEPIRLADAAVALLKRRGGTTLPPEDLARLLRRRGGRRIPVAATSPGRYSPAS